jgi:hypothetical protein
MKYLFLLILSVSVASAAPILTKRAAQNYTEYQASSANFQFSGVHFDSGRNGVHCPTCNAGNGNDRYVWSDTSGNGWIGHMNSSGIFTSATGKDELFDTFVYNSNSCFGESPFFAPSVAGTFVVYTRFNPGNLNNCTGQSGIGFASQTASGWTAGFLPGSITVGTSSYSQVPFPSTASSQARPSVLYFSQGASPQTASYQSLSNTSTPAAALGAQAQNAIIVDGGKPGVRWVPGTTQIVFMAPDATTNCGGNPCNQCWWTDTATGNVDQITSEAYKHTECFMFKAPEFADQYVVLSNTASVTFPTSVTRVNIYKVTGNLGDGSPILALYNQVPSPDSAAQYISEMEPFINCTPACMTWFFEKTSSVVITGGNQLSTPNGLMIANINATGPQAVVLASIAGTPCLQRDNPQYFIAPSGPQIHYNQNTINTVPCGSQFVNNGHWFINTLLGVPLGPCVGSSAESGLVSGC